MLHIRGRPMYVRITTRFVFSITSHFFLKWAISVKPIKSSCYMRIVRTYSVQHSSSWEANQFSASQEIPRILWNPKVYHHVYKNQPPVPILSQINTAHAHPSHFSEIHLNIIPYLCLGLPSGLFPSDFPIKTLYATLLSPYVLHSPPISFFWSNHPNNICWGVQIIKLLFV